MVFPCTSSDSDLRLQISQKQRRYNPALARMTTLVQLTLGHDRIPHHSPITHAKAKRRYPRLKSHIRPRSSKVRARMMLGVVSASSCDGRLSHLWSLRYLSVFSYISSPFLHFLASAILSVLLSRFHISVCSFTLFPLTDPRQLIFPSYLSCSFHFIRNGLPPLNYHTTYGPFRTYFVILYFGLHSLPTNHIYLRALSLLPLPLPFAFQSYSMSPSFVHGLLSNTSETHWHIL